MSAPVTVTDPNAPPVRRFKMMLRQNEYLVDVGVNNGRYPAGAVLLVDEETAIRWYERGVAEPASPEAETYGEVVRRNKRAEFLKRAKPVAGVFDQAVTRGPRASEPGLLPPPMPTRRGRAALLGAEVVSDPTGED